MIAMTVIMGTKYDCNLFQKGPNMIAMSNFVLKSRDNDFWAMKLIFDGFNHIMSFLKEIAIINSPIPNSDCNHI